MSAGWTRSPRCSTHGSGCPCGKSRECWRRWALNSATLSAEIWSSASLKWFGPNSPACCLYWRLVGFVRGSSGDLNSPACCLCWRLVGLVRGSSGDLNYPACCLCWRLVRLVRGLSGENRPKFSSVLPLFVLTRAWPGGRLTPPPPSRIFAIAKKRTALSTWNLADLLIQ